MADHSKDRILSSRDVKISRRDFVGGSAAAVAAFTIVPSYVLGRNGDTPPSEKLNIAGVGVGGMGGSNVNAASGENIVALCDVDDNYAAGTFKRYPKAKIYRDYRKMLDQQKEIDAVIVATPDHTHAVISMAAIKSGKNVYCQKPLTHCVYEARMLTEAARKAGVVTQMGNQGHSGEGIRLVCEWIWDGAIGAVREVHAWTNRPIWPQGLDRPEDTPAVPDTLDWDLWLGPAPERPYNPVYLPFSWRGWWDFGTGALGDMACHIIDPAFWALKLGYPIGVEACATKVNSESAPVASIVRYEFPSRGDMPPVKLTWYDGGMMPARPEELEPNRRMGDNEGGVLFVGDKGKLVCGCYGSSPRLIPETKMQEYQRPEKTIARVDGAEGGHERDWIRCCKEGRQPSSSFDYSGPLTETVVMGNLAIRCNGKKLDWDGLNMKVTNVDEANQYVRDQYRQGWSL
jgi:predicted dehydrogenase